MNPDEYSNQSGPLLNADTLEMVSLAQAYCQLVEQPDAQSAPEWARQALQLLPKLYLKGLALSQAVVYDETIDEIEHVVTEDDYNAVRDGVAAVLGTYDDYLDTFVEDMKYSDKPILKTISEDLADVYQDIRNFVAAWDGGYDEVMQAALQEIASGFGSYWGGRLLSAMRALHEVAYNLPDEEGEAQ